MTMRAPRIRVLCPLARFRMEQISLLENCIHGDPHATPSAPLFPACLRAGSWRGQPTRAVGRRKIHSAGGAAEERYGRGKTLIGSGQTADVAQTRAVSCQF